MARLLPFGLVLATLGTLAACQDPFDPFSETAETGFAVYGYLDTEADTQFVRVAQLRRRPEAPTTPSTPTVETLDEVTGAVVAWRDSLVTLTDGTQAALYYTTAAFLPGHTYRLRVGGAGRLTEARTQVPARPPPEVNPVRWSGTRYEQEVAWRNLPPPLPFDVTLTYRVQPGPSRPLAEFEVECFTCGGLVRGDWRSTIPLSFDAAEIRRRLGQAPGDTTAVLHGLRLRIVLLSAEWQQRGHNAIEGGEGLFAARAAFDTLWTLPDTVVAKLGFRTPR